MKIFADFHIHSYLSRACSKECTIESFSKNAVLKGLNLLGTGDFLHPTWLKEIKEKLEPLNKNGLFKFGDTLWVLTCEVSTIYEQDGKIRKVHHMIHAPDLETVGQMNSELSEFGDLTADGRPIFNNLTSPELVEILMGINKDILVYPAHAWTSWWACFGSKSGFDSLEECYKDQIKNIYAIETGMSSNPSMNWRLSKLDNIALVSNSDAHSPWTWRLGREFNAFDLEKNTYWEINDAIKKKDKSKFIFTGEVPPEYGKYHIDGHRNCSISLTPEQSKKLNNICPKCRRKLTIGVLNRVEGLADRPDGFIPKDAIPFKSLLPLYEIISFITGTNQLYSKKVIEEQNKLIDRFDNELNVLMNVSREDLTKVTSEKIADAIIKVREGKIRFEAGYDGVYGKPIFNSNIQIKRSFVDQKSLTEFQPRSKW